MVHERIVAVGVKVVEGHSIGEGMCSRWCGWCDICKLRGESRSLLGGWRDGMAP